MTSSRNARHVLRFSTYALATYCRRVLRFSPCALATQCAVLTRMVCWSQQGGSFRSTRRKDPRASPPGLLSLPPSPSLPLPPSLSRALPLS
eukprot:1007688-Rhodomonas_salina.2